MFNRIVGEAVGGGFELEFASFLDNAPDVVSFAKNYLAVGFKIDYAKANGDLSHYVPDFLVKAKGGIWIIEPKGREELGLPQKMTRLRQWCADANDAQPAPGPGGLPFRLRRPGWLRGQPAKNLRGAG